PRLALDTPQNQTCVPELIPPGMDPSQVDIPTFYPYTPGEVKHREKLAAELDMTPRGVQVRPSPSRPVRVPFADQ
ncbi:hypothetical protein BD309DRAFT_872322, partial [Dichomitus squalens]